jgi:hypothetical protein
VLLARLNGRDHTLVRRRIDACNRHRYAPVNRRWLEQELERCVERGLLEAPVRSAGADGPVCARRSRPSALAG